MVEIAAVARAETAVAVAFPVVVWMVEIAAVAAVAAVAAGAVVDRVEEDWVLADLGEVAMVVMWVVVALAAACWEAEGQRQQRAASCGEEEAAAEQEQEQEQEQPRQARGEGDRTARAGPLGGTAVLPVADGIALGSRARGL